MTGRNRFAAVLVVALVASGCAVIPTSGPVTKTSDDDGLGQSTVRYAPARPRAGASPDEIVRGYLDAMLAFPVSSGTAGTFLTSSAVKRWSPSDGVRIYSQPEVSPPTASPSQRNEPGPQGPSVEVKLAMFEDARLDRQGHYARRARATDITYRLERVDGEWRITNPQRGVLIDRKFFDDYFRPFDLFYFDRPGRQIQPDPIHVAVGDQLATALVTSLARGPLPMAEGKPRTYVPQLSALRPSVPITDDGVAEVDFIQDFGALSDSTRNHLSAQIVWTLRQVPEISAVRLIGGTTTLTADGSPLQPISSWGGFGPGTARGHAYAISDDRVFQIDGGDIKPLTGAWGRDAFGSVAVAVGDQGVAGVLAGRGAVRVTNRKGAAVQAFRGTGLITPRWDEKGRLWLVDRPAGVTRVRLLGPRSIRMLDIGGLSKLDPQTFELSPEGSRYAVTVAGSGRSRLYVGPVLRGAKDQILGLGSPARVFTTAQEPVSAVWASGTELTFLAESGSGVQVYTTRIDGSETEGGVSASASLLPDMGAAALTIETGDNPDRHATDARGRLWFQAPGDSWKKLGSKRFTGLTFGR